MSLKVIGLGVGRTGTYSMKIALEELGFGPCHHMEEVDVKSAEQLAQWKALAEGRGDIHAAYKGFAAAVDWPTAAFAPELVAAFPEAKFLLTFRDPEKWYGSFSETIMPLAVPSPETPPELLPFLDMVQAVLRKTGFVLPATKQEIIAAYNRHVAMVKAAIPADQLLIWDVSQGWEPLCRHLGVPVPERAYPRSNSTVEFWESVRTGERPAVH